MRGLMHVPCLPDVDLFLAAVLVVDADDFLCRLSKKIIGVYGQDWYQNTYPSGESGM